MGPLYINIAKINVDLHSTFFSLKPLQGVPAEDTEEITLKNAKYYH